MLPVVEGLNQQTAGFGVAKKQQIQKVELVKHQVFKARNGHFFFICALVCPCERYINMDTNFF